MIRPLYEHKKTSEQDTLNSLLWRIVMNQGGTIKVDYSDIKNIPKYAGIKVNTILGTEFIEIKAVVNSPIATPKKRIIR